MKERKKTKKVFQVEQGKSICPTALFYGSSGLQLVTQIFDLTYNQRAVLCEF